MNRGVELTLGLLMLFLRVLAVVGWVGFLLGLLGWTVVAAWRGLTGG